jgi:alpha-galactosidase
LLLIVLCLAGRVAVALDAGDVPADAPADAIMAGPAEVARTAEWAAAAFMAKRPQPPDDRPAAGDPQFLLASSALPFSFVYGGKPSAELLKDWQHTAASRELPDRTRYEVAWIEPRSGLRVVAEVIAYKRYPAVDWVLRFQNTGKQDTPILEDVQALDVTLATGNAQQPAVLHHLAGDDCSPRSFMPLESPLPVGGAIRLAPQGGRSSNGTFPFFNFECQGSGLFTAVGWTGQWAASFQRGPDGLTRLRGGMERTHLLLHPGETIRSPRILLMAWQGDRMAAHNRFRRLMLFHYTPKEQSRPVALPIFWQCYDRYHGHPAWPTEAGQCRAAEMAAKTGCDFLWLDAAWFPGDFPNGVGNWFCKPKAFPNGLKPVSDACHKLGLRFIVWFEPERVAAGSQIAREHPEFVFGGAGGGLFKLNDPAARQWLTDLLVRRIRDFGMDWYRNDFNMDPLPAWRRNDAPDRQGMTEIRYVEGHYALWDAIIASKPGLFIDNCASGGRRIDIETLRRSVPLWRSDTACQAGRGDWHQAQAIGMSYYLPLHQICAWTTDAYEMRSSSGPGAIVQFAYLDGGFSAEAAKQAVAEVKENQKYFYGDFYPLTDCSTEPDRFVAYQVHRPDLDAGLVLAFRRAKCNVPRIEAALGGLNPKLSYEVEFIDQQRNKTTKTLGGRSLRDNLPLYIPQPGASLLVRYHPARGAN